MSEALTPEVLPQVSDSVINRAQEVRAALLRIKESIEDNFIDLCELLYEAQQGEYHCVWGYSRFGEWVEQASGLDISARQAYYYLSIARKMKELGLSRELVKQAKISKLKEIFSLEPSEVANEMKTLVAKAVTGASLDEIREEVAVIRAKSGGQPSVYMTLKIELSAKETVERAIELARRRYGSVEDEKTGEVKDASVSKCIELICAEFLADPNNYPEEIESE